MEFSPTLTKSFLVGLGMSFRVSGDICAQISKWRSSSGDTWCLERLKAFRFHMMTNGKPPKDFKPKGGFKFIIKKFLNDVEEDPDTARSWLSKVTSLFTNFRVGKISDVDLMVIKDSIMRPGLTLSQSLSQSPVYRDRYWSFPPIRIPTLSYWSWCKNHGLSLQEWEDSLKGWSPEMFSYTKHLLTFDEESIMEENLCDSPHDVLGTIHISKEPAGKLRYFASPLPLIKFLSEPLKRGLLDALKGYGTDCTHNQEKGARTVRDWLREGKRCYSLDLSKATDSMPLQLQVQMLLRRGPTSISDYYHLDLIEFLATGMWNFPDGSLVNFRCGQPLGLGYSFPLFAMTHNHILLELCADLNMNTLPFVILGDDIVISDQTLAERYMQFIQGLGMDFSLAKCVVSDSVAEFAGFMIYPSGWYRKLKFIPNYWADPLNFLKMSSPSFVKWFPAKYRKQLLFCLSVFTDSNPLGISVQHKTRLQWQYLESSLNQRDYKMSYTGNPSGFFHWGPTGKGLQFGLGERDIPYEKNMSRPIPQGVGFNLNELIERSGSFWLPRHVASHQLLKYLNTIGFHSVEQRMTTRNTMRGKVSYKLVNKIYSFLRPHWEELLAV